MINKKMTCFILLFYLFPVAACMQMVDLTKKPNTQLQLSFFERKLKYEQDVAQVSSRLDKKFGYVVLGNSPRAISFLHSIYKAKKAEDFTEALMNEKFFIELYAKERIEDCSVFGIITMADAVTFVEKKNFIQKLLRKDYDCTPEEKIKHQFKLTLKDKEFGFFAKIKEFGPSIIQEILCKIVLIRHMNDDFKLLDIAPIIHNTNYGLRLLHIRKYIEELLFLLNLDEQESLL